MDTHRSCPSASGKTILIINLSQSSLVGSHQESMWLPFQSISRSTRGLATIFTRCFIRFRWFVVGDVKFLSLPEFCKIIAVYAVNRWSIDTSRHSSGNKRHFVRSIYPPRDCQRIFSLFTIVEAGWAWVCQGCRRGMFDERVIRTRPRSLMHHWM